MRAYARHFNRKSDSVAVIFALLVTADAGPAISPLETPQNPPEEPQNPPRVAPLELEPTQEEVEIVAIRLLHRSRGVVCGPHGLCDDLGQQGEVTG
jgi:hypothetical protein